MKRKKPWKAPQLIVLVRGRAEESVLETCKGGGFMGPNNADYFCQAPLCGWCDSWAAS